MPNTTQDLYEEGRLSCLDECTKWDGNKISCMENALDCPSMTEICGL